MLITGAKELRASPSLPTLAATALRMWEGLGWAVECWWELRAGSVLKAFLFGKSCKHGDLLWGGILTLSTACRIFLSQALLDDDAPRGATVKPLVSGHFKISWCLASMNKSHMMNWVCHTFPQCSGVTCTMASVAGPNIMWLHLF